MALGGSRHRLAEKGSGGGGAYSLLYIIQMFPVANLPLFLLLYTFTSIKCWARPDSALPASVKVLTNCTWHMLHNTFINVSYNNNNNIRIITDCVTSQL